VALGAAGFREAHAFRAGKKRDRLKTALSFDDLPGFRKKRGRNRYKQNKKKKNKTKHKTPNTRPTPPATKQTSKKTKGWTNEHPVNAVNDAGKAGNRGGNAADRQKPTLLRGVYPGQKEGCNRLPFQQKGGG